MSVKYPPLKIDPNGPPISTQIKDHIRSCIRGHVFRSGQRLLSMRALANQLNVSLTPVERAMRELSIEGLLETRHGKGTFVKVAAPSADQDRLTMNPLPRVPDAKVESILNTFRQRAPGVNVVFSNENADIAGTNFDLLPSITNELQDVDDLVCDIYGRTKEGSSVFDPLRVDGKLYMLPYSWIHKVVLINTSLFDKAGVPLPSHGWTWEESVELARAMTRPEAGQYGYVATGAWDYMLSHLFQNNGSFFDPTGTVCRVAEPEGVETGAYLRKLAPYGLPEGQGIPDMYRAFHEGRVAMFYGDSTEGNYHVVRTRVGFEATARLLPVRKRPVCVLRANGLGLRRNVDAAGPARTMLEVIADVDAGLGAAHQAVPFQLKFQETNEIAAVYLDALRYACSPLHEVRPEFRTARHRDTYDLFTSALNMIRFTEIPIPEILARLRDQVLEMLRPSEPRDHYDFRIVHGLTGRKGT